MYRERRPEMQEKDTAQQAAQWLQIFQEQAHSGQTVEQWCKEHHIWMMTIGMLIGKPYWRKSSLKNQKRN